MHKKIYSFIQFILLQLSITIYIYDFRVDYDGHTLLKKENEFPTSTKFKFKKTNIVCASERVDRDDPTHPEALFVVVEFPPNFLELNLNV